ncbi:MAG TPA: glycosyltransferase family 2 protein [Vicinamibacterales bacterium]|nr:glycosyltransferase family 2 protein [Vicinamibacterales bacterium]
MDFSTRPLIPTALALLLFGVPQQEAGRGAGAAQYQHTPAERPRTRVELPPDAAHGRVVHVKPGDSLQAALDAANPGDRITLDPGATYTGPFRLPRKDGDQWIVISTAGQLPPRGQRVQPSHAAQMPHLVAEGDVVIQAMPGAHHYRLVGLEVSPTDGTFVNTLIQLGDRERTLNDQPHHIVIERSYLHGDKKRGSRRGVALNSRQTAVVDSAFADFKEAGADSQALSGWNGAGPFRIENNSLEAAGENVMFGGADPTVPQLVPADIEVLRNHMSKPLRWKVGDASYEGTEWSVKNLFELKNARRVLIEGNVFERNWTHAQNGFAILFTVRNQDGGAPWSIVEDVTFVNNIVRHVGGGVNVLGRDDNHPSEQTRRLEIRNNVFLDVGGAWGSGRLFQLLDGTNNVTIAQNTGLQTGSILFGGDHAPHTAFVFQNNIAPHNEHGIIGSSTEPGNQTLARYFPRAVVNGNVIVGGPSGSYPTDNTFVKSLDEAGVAQLRRGVLQAPSPQGGRTGTAGANLSELLKAVNGVAPDAAAQAALPADDEDGAVALRAAVATFWTSIGLLFYVYAGYPIIAAVRARLRSRPVARPVERRLHPATIPFPERRIRVVDPRVSIVVVAHNEASSIEARLENLLALDYPAHRLEIIVGSDGSTDDTVKRARKYEPFGVRVLAFSERSGKPAVLNAVVPHVSGDIVLFADARQRFEPSALRAIVADFADRSVGAVSGELILEAEEGTASAGQGAALYWRYEKLIRSAESRSDSTVGATGAIYAIRRSLFVAIPNDTVLDDVLIPLRIVQQGYRVIFEPAARAFDRTSATAAQEFARKSRTIAGTFQLFARERWLFDPRRNRLWFATMSHKGLRLLLPLLHAGAIGANVAAASWWPYQWLLGAHVLFYAAAIAGGLQRRGRHRLKIFTVPYTLCLLCWADVVGFYRFVTNRQPVTWERQPASLPAATAARQSARRVAA